jgi:hypothetical protein
MSHDGASADASLSTLLRAEDDDTGQGSRQMGRARAGARGVAINWRA